MTCGQCGQEIADTALICYRCGTAADAPASAPDPAAPGRRRWSSLMLGIVWVAVVAFFVSELLRGRPPAPLVWAMLAAAGGLLAWRLRLG